MSASGSCNQSWHADELCEQLGSLRVRDGGSKPVDMDPFGTTNVWTPPTPAPPPLPQATSFSSYAQIHSQRLHEQQQKKHDSAVDLDKQSARLFSDFRARRHNKEHRRRSSESSDYARFLSGYSDDDRDDKTSRTGSFTALDFLRQSNTLQRGRTWSGTRPSATSSKARDTFHGSRGSFSRRNSFYENPGRSNSMTSLSALLESPTRVSSNTAHKSCQQKHRGQPHTAATDASSRYQRDRVSMQPDHLRALQQQQQQQRQQNGDKRGVHHNQAHGRAPAHAQTQAHFLATRRSSASMGHPSSLSSSRQLTSPPSSVKSMSPRLHASSAGPPGGAHTIPGGDAHPNALTSPNPLGPEGYNSFRVIASPHALRAGSSPGSGASNGRDRSGLVHINDELYKTELCSNWITTGACSYGSKCNFSHGYEDLRPRKRVENYKSQPCCDPARMGCRRCMYDKRCNYAHPGEALRRPRPAPYFDKNYFAELKKDFPKTQFPFGIYL